MIAAMRMTARIHTCFILIAAISVSTSTSTSVSINVSTSTSTSIIHITIGIIITGTVVQSTGFGQKSHDKGQGRPLTPAQAKDSRPRKGVHKDRHRQRAKHQVGNKRHELHDEPCRDDACKLLALFEAIRHGNEVGQNGRAQQHGSRHGRLLLHAGQLLDAILSIADEVAEPHEQHPH